MEWRIIIVVLLILILVYISYKKGFNSSEGFESPIYEAQNRVNPLASKQHPLKHVPDVGLSDSASAALRSIYNTALDVPTQISSGEGSYTTLRNMVKINPRIDNASSFLGLVDFCKRVGSTEENPFLNADFMKNCGMCMSSGKLITGETFTTPTGVVVYNEDKQHAFTKQRAKGYNFPRAIPSLKAARCDGAEEANLNNDTQAPTLILDSRGYIESKGRAICRIRRDFGNNCGKCLTNNEWSFIDPNGAFRPVSLYLYGSGSITVKIGGNTIGTYTLTSSKTEIDISNVDEGTAFVFDIEGSESNQPSIYGAIKGRTVNNTDFFLPIENAINMQMTGNSYEYFWASIRIPEIPKTLTKIKSVGSTSSIHLTGSFPLTFVDETQIAAYDCKDGPYTTIAGDNELFSDDPCIIPKNQGPDNYTPECLINSIITNGCSTNGTWATSGLPLVATSGKNIGQINTWLNDNKNRPENSMGCYAIAPAPAPSPAPAAGAPADYTPKSPISLAPAPPASQGLSFLTNLRCVSETTWREPHFGDKNTQHHQVLKDGSPCGFFPDCGEFYYLGKYILNGSGEKGTAGATNTSNYTWSKFSNEYTSVPLSKYNINNENVYETISNTSGPICFSFFLNNVKAMFITNATYQSIDNNTWKIIPYSGTTLSYKISSRYGNDNDHYPANGTYHFAYSTSTPTSAGSTYGLLVPTSTQIPAPAPAPSGLPGVTPKPAPSPAPASPPKQDWGSNPTYIPLPSSGICPANTYLYNTFLPNKYPGGKVCKPCVEGSTSPAGSTSGSNCTCQNGTILYYGRCVPAPDASGNCPANTYKTNTTSNTIICNSCGYGTSPAGSTNVRQCSCAVNAIRSTLDSPCGSVCKGISFSSGGDATTCQCPPGYYPNHNSPNGCIPL